MPQLVKQKVLLLGDGAVGKTSLIRRFVLDQFSDDYIATVGTKVTKKDMKLEVRGEDIFLTLVIWDVLGQRGYTSVQQTSFRGARGVLMVWDVTRPETLDSVGEYWIPQLWSIAGKVPIVLTGNKVDLVTRRSPYKERTEEFAEKYQSEIFLSSAKTGENVESIFKTLGKAVLTTKDTRPVEEIKPDKESTRTLIQVADKIIADFCEGFGGFDSGMPVIKQQFAKAGVNVNSPTREALEVAVRHLAEIEKGFKDTLQVERNLRRRIGWIKAAQE